MHVIRLTATAGSDGILRLMVPVGAAGEYELVVTASPKGAGAPAGAKKAPARSANPDGLGWTAGIGEDAGGSIDDILFDGLDTDKKPDALGGLS